MHWRENGAILYRNLKFKFGDAGQPTQNVDPLQKEGLLLAKDFAVPYHATLLLSSCSSVQAGSPLFSESYQLTNRN